MSIPAKQIADLKDFVQFLKANPDALWSEELKFFKTYLESLHCRLPLPKNKPAASAPKQEAPPSAAPGSPPKPAAAKPESTPAPAPAPEEPEIVEPTYDDEGPDDEIIPADAGEELPLGDPSREPSDEEYEKLAEIKEAAAAALEAGNLQAAVDSYTAALNIMPSPLMLARRAECLLKLQRPVAAIRDCAKAMEQNPDSAKALKVRGMALRKLGKYEEAAKYLHQGQMADYDEQIDVLCKWVDARVKIIQSNDRKRREYEKLCHIRDQKKRARAEYEAAGGGKPGAAPSGMGGMGGMPGMGGMGGMPGGFQMPDLSGMGLGNFADMMKNIDPALLTAALSNPKIMGILGELQSGSTPEMIKEKYKNDPEVMELLQKFMSAQAGGEAPEAAPAAEPAGAAPMDPGLD